LWDYIELERKWKETENWRLALRPWSKRKESEDEALKGPAAVA